MSRTRKPRRQFICMGLATALAAASGVALALSTTIDDSGTVVQSPTVPMRWQTLSPRQTHSTLMNGSAIVRVRLNVSPWLRRSGRIYLVLPAQQPGSIHATWGTQGHLLPGQVTSGGRTLVYSGPISSPFVEDVLQLAIIVDGRHIYQAQELVFHFEMETT